MAERGPRARPRWRSPRGPCLRIRASIRSSIWSIWAFGDRPAGEGLSDARLDLVAVQGLARSVALDDHQADVLDPLVGREPPAAGRHSRRRRMAPPASAGAGIHHPVVVDTTPRTPHRQEPQDVVARANASRRHDDPVNRRARRASCRPRAHPASTPLADGEQARHRPAGSSPGRTRCAIDQSVSPERTTTTVLRGGRRRFPPPDRARRQRAQEHGDQGGRHDGAPSGADERTFAPSAQDGRTPVRCQELGSNICLHSPGTGATLRPIGSSAQSRPDRVTSGG